MRRLAAIPVLAVALTLAWFAPEDSRAQLSFDDGSGQALVWTIAQEVERRWSLWCGCDYDGLRCEEQVWEFSERRNVCSAETASLLPPCEAGR